MNDTIDKKPKAWIIEKPFRFALKTIRFTLSLIRGPSVEPTVITLMMAMLLLAVLLWFLDTPPHLYPANPQWRWLLRDLQRYPHYPYNPPESINSEYSSVLLQTLCSVDNESSDEPLCCADRFPFRLHMDHEFNRGDATAQAFLPPWDSAAVGYLLLFKSFNTAL